MTLDSFKTRLNLFLILLVSISSCVTAPSFTVTPPSERALAEANRLITVSPGVRRNRLSDDENVARLGIVSNKLRRQANTLCQIVGEKPASECKFTVKYADNDAFNAYAREVQGENQIVLNIGLLNRVHSEAELAFVVAHEIAHHMLAHFDDDAGFTTGEAIGLILAASVLADDSDITTPQQTSDIAESIVNMSSAVSRPSFNRSQEAEADLIAIRLLETSGFDLSEGVGALTTMFAVNPSSSSFLSSHPANLDRIANYLEYQNKEGYSALLARERSRGCPLGNCNITTADFGTETTETSSPPPRDSSQPGASNGSPGPFYLNNEALQAAIEVSAKYPDIMIERYIHWRKESHTNLRVGSRLNNRQVNSYLKYRFTIEDPHRETPLENERFYAYHEREKTLWVGPPGGMLLSSHGWYTRSPTFRFISNDEIAASEINYRGGKYYLGGIELDIPFPDGVGVRLLREIQSLIVASYDEGNIESY